MFDRLQNTLHEKCPIRSFSDPYFPALGLNTERYFNLLIFSPNTVKYGPGKLRTRTLFALVDQDWLMIKVNWNRISLKRKLTLLVKSFNAVVWKKEYNSKIIILFVNIMDTSEKKIYSKNRSSTLSLQENQQNLLSC